MVNTKEATDAVLSELAAVVLAFLLAHYLVTSATPEYSLW